MGNTKCLMKECNKLQVVGGFCSGHADPVKLAEKNKKVMERRAAEKLEPTTVYPEQAEIIFSDSDLLKSDLAGFQNLPGLHVIL